MEVNVTIERYSGFSEDGGRYLSNEVKIEYAGLIHTLNVDFVRDDYLKLRILEKILELHNIQVKTTEVGTGYFKQMKYGN